MRTVGEVAAFYQGAKDRDMFGSIAGILVPFLPFDLARPFLEAGSTKEEWERDGVPYPLVREFILEQLKDYMDFAWEKAEDHRGLSALRSHEKMKAWLWLLEDEETLRFAATDKNYNPYGAPILAAISKKYGFPIPEGKRIANMIAGKPCQPGCLEGCES